MIYIACSIYSRNLPMLMYHHYKINIMLNKIEYIFRTLLFGRFYYVNIVSGLDRRYNEKLCHSIIQSTQRPSLWKFCVFFQCPRCICIEIFF